VARGTREGGIRAKIHADQDGACYLIRRSARPYWCECRTAIEAVASAVVRNPHGAEVLTPGECPRWLDHAHSTVS
jgi:hypothetical protein